MREPLPRGGLIRKLWIGESERYRDHLLRLDAASRRNRFAGAVSDEFVRNYADLSFGIDALIHGFFVDDTLRGAAGCSSGNQSGGFALPPIAVASYSLLLPGARTVAGTPCGLDR